MKREHLALLGLLGFLGVGPALQGDWAGAVWLLWFLWFFYGDEVREAAPKASTGKQASNTVVSASTAKTPAPKAKSAGKTRRTKKQENIQRVFTVAKSAGTITNDAVEELLGVSDATATRYLQALEDEGKIKQIGKAGRSVLYEVA